MARCEEKAPPFFESLGEAAREVFTKGYGFGLVRVDFTTRAASGVEFNTRGASHTESGRVSGALETRYRWPERGLRLVECWSTDNCLGTRISVDDQLAKGLQLVFDTSFSPNTGKKTGLVKVLYARPFVSATTDVDVSLEGPIVASSVVLAARGWLAGYHMGLDVGKRKITSNRISLGYMTEDFQLLTNVYAQYASATWPSCVLRHVVFYDGSRMTFNWMGNAGFSQCDVVSRVTIQDVSAQGDAIQCLLYTRNTLGMCS